MNVTKCFPIAIAILAAMSGASLASAQTRGARDNNTAYGARIDAKGEPATLNPKRINSRVKSRLQSRLSLRVERYRPDNAQNPIAAFATGQTNDNARGGTTPTHPATGQQ